MPILLCVITSLSVDIAHCALPEIPGGSFIDSSVTNGVACGEDLIIRCFNGYRLVGANSARCNPDGSYTWAGIRPRCRRLLWTR